MLKRTEPALTEITQYITIERTVGVGPGLVALVHDARSEKIETLHQRRSAQIRPGALRTRSEIKAVH